MTRRLHDLPWWKLFILNCYLRSAERAKRGFLFGPALLDRVKGLK